MVQDRPIGGTSYSNAPFQADTNGNVSLNEATIQASGSWTDSFGVTRSQTFSVTPATTNIVTLTETTGSIPAGKRSKTTLGSQGIDSRGSDNSSDGWCCLVRYHRPQAMNGLIPERIIADMLVQVGPTASGFYSWGRMNASHNLDDDTVGTSLELWSSLPGGGTRFWVAVGGYQGSMVIENLAVTVNGSQAFTGTVQVKKPDDTTATLTFKQGWLVGVN